MRRRKGARKAPESEPLLSSSAEPTPAGPLILWFDEVGKGDAHIVGGKGANLGECASAGLPVPPGFCVTRHAFDATVESISSSAGGSRSGSSRSGSRSGSSAGSSGRTDLQRQLMEHPLAPGVEAGIVDAYRRLSSSAACGLVAVRSSATAEDSAEASFAGQLETYLGVEGEEAVLEAVRKCWASLYAERVEHYRKLAGCASTSGGGGGGGGGEGGAEGDADGVSCCVVVQMLVEAEAAGVLFTANPVTSNRDEFVVTANWGLGESVVADLVQPDTFILTAASSSPSSASHSIRHREISTKEQMVCFCRNGTESGGGERAKERTKTSKNNITSDTKKRGGGKGRKGGKRGNNGENGTGPITTTSTADATDTTDATTDAIVASEMTVKQLRAGLKEHGASTSGLKAALVERLQELEDAVDMHKAANVAGGDGVVGAAPPAKSSSSRQMSTSATVASESGVTATVPVPVEKQSVPCVSDDVRIERSLYTIQRSEMFTLRNYMLHTETRHRNRNSH